MFKISNKKRKEKAMLIGRKGDSSHLFQLIIGKLYCMELKMALLTFFVLSFFQIPFQKACQWKSAVYNAKDRLQLRSCGKRAETDPSFLFSVPVQCYSVQMGFPAVEILEFALRVRTSDFLFHSLCTNEV